MPSMLAVRGRRLLRSLVYLPWRLFFGNDIFVSYARIDGTNYAAALADRLGERGYSVRIDQWASDTGASVPWSLIWALRCASMVVLVGTKAAGRSAGVRREVEEFLPTGRTILLVDVDGHIRESTWWPLVEGLAVSDDSQQEGKAGTAKVKPSGSTVDRIINSFSYTRRSYRQLWVSAIAALVLVGMLVSALFANRLRNEAQVLADRSTLIVHARSALGTNNPEEALVRASESLLLRDAMDARLLVADARNRGITTLLHRMEHIGDIAVGGANEEHIAAIGVVELSGEARSQLWLGNLEGRGITLHAEGEYAQYQALSFGPGGDTLFVALLDYIVDPEGAIPKLWISEFDLNLNELRRFELPAEPTYRDQSGDQTFDVRRITDLRLSNTGTELLAAGFASGSWLRGVSNSMPHHYRAWVSLEDIKVGVYIDTQRELSSFHRYAGRSCELGEGTLVVDGYDEIIAIEKAGGQSLIIGRHAGGVTDIECDQEGRRVLVVGSTNELSILAWNTDGTWSQSILQLSGDAEATQVRRIDQHLAVVSRQNGALSMVWLDDGFREETYGSYGNITWAGRRETQRLDHTAEISAIALSTDRTWMASADVSGVVRLWRPRVGDSQSRSGATRGVVDLVFAQGNDSVVYGTMAGELIRARVDSGWRRHLPGQDPESTMIERRISESLLDEGGGLSRYILREHLGLVRRAAWGSDGSLWAERYGGTLRAWSSEFEELDQRPEEELEFDDLDLFAGPRSDSDLPFAHNPEGGIRRIEPDVANDLNIEERLGASGEVEEEESQERLSGILGSKGNLLIERSEDGNLYFWRLDQPSEFSFRLQPLFGAAGDVWVFSPNGRYLLIENQIAGKTAWTLIDLKEISLRLLQGDFANSAAVSDDGVVVVAGRTGETYFFDAESNQPWVLPRHQRYVSSVSISSDGRWFATGSRDRSARLWASDGFGFIPFSFTNPVETVAFNATGDRLAVAAGFSVHVLHVPSHVNTLMEGQALGAPLEFDEDPRLRVPNVDTAVVYLIWEPDTMTVKDAADRTLQHRPTKGSEATKARLLMIADSSSTELERATSAVELLLHPPTSSDDMPLLIQSLASENPSHDPVLAILVEFLRSTDAEFLRVVKQSWSPDLPLDAKRGLLHISSEINPTGIESLELFEAALKDDALLVQALAAIALPHRDENLPILFRALIEVPELREEAAQAMVRSDGDAVPFFLDACDVDGPTPMGYARHYEVADTMLRQIGEAALPYLKDPLSSDSDRLRRCALSAVSALETLPQEFARLFIEELEAHPGRIDSGKVRALAQAEGLESERLSRALVAVIVEDGPGWQAAQDILEQQGRQAVLAILQAWPKADSQAQRLLSWVLRDLGAAAEDAIPVLVEVLASNRADLVSDAAEALGAIGPAAAPAAPYIVTLLPRFSSYFRTSLLEALRDIGSCDSICVHSILELLEEELVGQDLGQYALTPGALEAAVAAGLPQDVRHKVRPFVDLIGRERPLFLQLLSRYLSPEEMRRHSELLLRMSKLSGRNCDENGVIEAAFEVLQVSPQHTESSQERLHRLLSEQPDCPDVQGFGRAVLDRVPTDTKTH